MGDTVTFSDGDWVVHNSFGVGCIECTEIKDISGEETRYFRIQTSNSTYWMPVEQMDSELIRPVSDEDMIEEAIAALKRQPQEMSSNHKTRDGRIKRVRRKNTPQSIARLIRDLRARRREKGVLNQNERAAFGTLKQRLIEEWSLVKDASSDTVEARLNDLLDRPNN